MNVQPFSPDFVNTKSISATATSANVSLANIDTNTGTSGQGSNVRRIVNAGPNTVFIRWGVGVQTALLTDMPLLAGTVEVFSFSPDANNVGAICASGQTATVYITGGEGQ